MPGLINMPGVKTMPMKFSECGDLPGNDNQGSKDASQ
jgi:hypothetical protein